jgi:DNA-binding NtrC family response regulator
LLASLYFTNMNEPIEILLIDDNVRSYDIFGFALNDLKINYLCRFAKSVEEAINILNNQRTDYIFIDVNMPVLQGFKFLKKLKYIQSANKVPIVIYSEHPDNDLCKKAMKHGVLSAIKKTREIFELINELKTILFKDYSQVTH